MNKYLTWIAAVSLSIAAACAALAALVSDQPFAAVARGCGTTSGAASETADLDWQGSDAVTLHIPARVHYQPGPVVQATVSGDPEIISHVRMHGGILSWDTADWEQTVDCLAEDQMVVRLTGPAVTSWTIHGSGALDLSELKQQLLLIAVHGSAAITATGAVQQVSLDAAGSTRADLSRLVAQHADAHVHGSAHIDLAPREDADISISGSGLVAVHGAGARIRSHVTGSGQVTQLP